VDFPYLAESVGPFPTAVGGQFDTFTTKKSVDPLPISVILAGRLRLGSKLLLRARGHYGTTGTPNLTWGFWFGTRALAITGDIAVSSVIVTPSGAAAFPWEMEWEGICTAVGTSGALVGQGVLRQGTSLTAYSSFPIPITAALRTVSGFDTTIERAIGVSATFGTSNGANLFVVNQSDVMILN
jgi:hypothetical protein